MRIEFTIPGPPIGKGRPKFFRRGNFVGTYTPDKTANFENLVKLSYIEVCQDPPTDQPVSVSIDAYFPIPKSGWKKADREKALYDRTPVLKKPDIDNVMKSILDGLNKIAYTDDSQVYKIRCSKYYSNNPRTVVAIVKGEVL